MQATTVRPETPERWARALGRAVAAGLDPMEIGGREGLFAVESGSRPGLAYLVSDGGRSCTCPASQAADPVCKHRAIVLFLTGDLALPSVACPGCCGEGWQAPGWGGWDGTPTRCGDCGGAGRVDATLAQVAAGAACGRCRGAGDEFDPDAGIPAHLRHCAGCGIYLASGDPMQVVGTAAAFCPACWDTEGEEASDEREETDRDETAPEITETRERAAA